MRRVLAWVVSIVAWLGLALVVLALGGVVGALVVGR
jgi:hypothetical protein